MPGDVESEGESNINLRNNPELRWSFIRKVYSIIIFQLLLIITVVSVVLFVQPVANFFNSKQSTLLNIFLIFVPFIGLGSIDCNYYLQKYPLNYFLLLIFGVSSALPVGLSCVFAGGN
ncbi:BI1-like protein [Trifolium medium]|uniref:BI1-like protein n=1 Tax=Trifolium medium TaxID=97028 RepID=A0A392PGV7_9FABA|nr:BI1-like protein [Trifolium medium]